MASATKILGQTTPVADTDTTHYTVPAATQVALKLFICNTGTVAYTYRVGVDSSGGATLSVGKAIRYGDTIAPGETVEITGICLAAAATLLVRASNAAVIFTSMGIEDTGY